jgi:hypothetical protein
LTAIKARAPPRGDHGAMRQVISDVAEYDASRVSERSGGFYWVSEDRKREYGPFATLLEAVQDMAVPVEETPEPGESLEEAEAEIGVSDWIDPDTGEPAEDGTRLEEH